jgi:hypothetical protein
VNRQEEHAYATGWAARNAGLDINEVLGPVGPGEGRILRDDGFTVVEMAEAYEEAIRRGFEDAVCDCGHAEGAHESDYGCRGSHSVTNSDTGGVEAVECFCTAFQSAGQAKRVARGRARGEHRRREQDVQEEG